MQRWLALIVVAFTLTLLACWLGVPSYGTNHGRLRRAVWIHPVTGGQLTFQDYGDYWVALWWSEDNSAGVPAGFVWTGKGIHFQEASP